MRLEGKVAVVTGAGSGIGKEIAERFAAEGARVMGIDLAKDAVEAVCGGLPGDGHAGFGADVADSGSVEAAFASIDEACGRVDILINNAGIDRCKGDGFDELMQGEIQLLHMEDDALRRMLGVNVEGVFYCTKRALAIMKREGTGGSIVNLSSIAGLVGQGTVHYSAAKAAVLGFTRSLARSVGHLNVRVNAICPGVIDTPMTQAVPDAALQGIIKQTPLRRVGLPEDISNAALYLASDEASFVTGQWLSPNGGVAIA